MTHYTIHDSGQRQEFAGGMVRDTDVGKVQWHRVAAGPLLRRWAEHLSRGAGKYPDVMPGMPNWMLAAGEDEYQRFRASAFRHFMQWWAGESDEDHAAAVLFNINGAEYVRQRLGHPFAGINPALEKQANDVCIEHGWIAETPTTPADAAGASTKTNVRGDV